MDNQFLRQISGPSSEPVTTSEIKNYCRINTSADDVEIDGMIKAARDSIEDETGIVMVQQTYEYQISALINGMRLPIGPLNSLDSVEYYDENNNLKTLSSNSYRVYNNDRIAYFNLTDNYDKPSDIGDRSYPWIITFKAGWSSSKDVPDRLKVAIKMLVCHWYDWRGVAVNASMSHIPQAIDRIISQYKIPLVI